MALDPVANFAIVTVSTGYDASATSIVLSSGHGSKLPSAPFNLVWWNSTDYSSPSDDPNVEIVRCTTKSTDTLTVTRAQEGTVAATHNTSSKVYKMMLGVTAKMITDISTALDGKVTGPSSATDGNMAVFDGTTGKILKDGGIPARGLDVNVQTITTDLTLSSSSQRVQILNPSGGHRTITLPSPTAGLEFYIFNSAPSTSPLKLICGVSDIYAQTTLHVIGDGTKWLCFVTSGWNDGVSDNISIGKNANGNNGGVAIGGNAQGNSAGISIGDTSVGCESSVGIGKSAQASNYSVSIGRESISDWTSNSIGYKSDSSLAPYSSTIGTFGQSNRVGEFSLPFDSFNRKTAYGIVGWTGQTTDSTQTELFLYGTSPYRCSILSNSTVLFSVMAVARDNTNNKSKSWKVEGTIQRDGSSNTSIVGEITKTVIADSGVTWDIDVGADSANKSLYLKVTGAASTTIRWFCDGQLHEVRA